MATIRKPPSGKWNAQVPSKGRILASSTHSEREAVQQSHPAVHCGRINFVPTFSKQIADVAVGKRVSAIPAHRQQDDIYRKTIPVEWIMLHRHLSCQLIQEVLINWPNNATNPVTQMDIVQLVYRPLAPQGSQKEHEFSRIMMDQRWEQGKLDAEVTLDAAPWLAPKKHEVGVRLFDVWHEQHVAKGEASAESTEAVT